jgi:hypothetical protein
MFRNASLRQCASWAQPLPRTPEWVRVEEIRLSTAPDWLEGKAFPGSGCCDRAFRSRRFGILVPAVLFPTSRLPGFHASRGRATQCRRL